MHPGLGPVPPPLINRALLGTRLVPHGAAFAVCL